MTSPQYYGTQPDAKGLPKVLPAGSRTLGHDEDFDAHALVRLEHFEHGERYVCDEGAGCCWCPPSHIDWSTVPLQPAPDRPGEAKCPGCAEAAKGARIAANNNGTCWTYICKDCRKHHVAEPDRPGEDGEPMVGEEWETIYGPAEIRGIADGGWHVRDADGRIDRYGCRDTFIRRISPAASPTGKGEAKCPRCGSPDLCLIADKCNGCGVTGLELRVAKIRDPYRNTPEHTNPTAFAAYCLGENAKHAAMKEQHAADLDRSSAERRRVLERNCRHWAPAWSSPSSESDH